MRLLVLFLLIPLGLSAQYRAQRPHTNPLVADSGGQGFRYHWDMEISDEIVITNIKYGYLYNWYAATDAKNLAGTGWHVPTYTEQFTLMTYISVGGYLKETGTTYWTTPNTGATNQFNFNGRGAGGRIGLGGSFMNIKNNLYIMSTSTQTNMIKYYYLRYDMSTFTLEYSNKWCGLSVRLIKDATTLTEGQQGYYTGNDGKVYRTIAIGNPAQEWLADDLCETKYRDGTDIPEVTDGTTWAALTSGARCSYNNDESNAK